MTVNDIMTVAESLKNTEATLLPAQPEVDVPEEGIPVLAGLKKYFEIRYEDGGMWCGPYVNAEGKLRQFRFKSPSAATPGNWRIIPNDQPAATTASAAAGCERIKHRTCTYLSSHSTPALYPMSCDG